MFKPSTSRKWSERNIATPRDILGISNLSITHVAGIYQNIINLFLVKSMYELASYKTYQVSGEIIPYTTPFVPLRYFLGRFLRLN